MISAIDETELERLIDLYNKAQSEPWNPLDDQDYIEAACNAVPALVAEVRRLRAEAKQGGIDYCALIDRHDAQFVRAEKLREKVEALQKNYDCEHAALMRHEHMVAELMEKVDAWEWFEECFEVMQWLMANGQSTPESRIVDVISNNARFEALMSTNLARERAVHADRE